VNPGADPGPDDSGLPPVGIEIPDDARALDRDVLAYRREIRARRRRERTRKLLAPLRGHVLLIPLIAACTALLMLVSMLLPVLVR